MIEKKKCEHYYKPKRWNRENYHLNKDFMLINKKKDAHLEAHRDTFSKEGNLYLDKFRMSILEEFYQASFGI